MKNLISMVDFVFEQKKLLNTYPNHDKGALFERCGIYANFLKQPLELWMFVPCKLVNDVCVVLNIPIEPEPPYNDKKCDVWQQYIYYLKRYQQAKEVCIFNNNLLSLIEIKELITQGKKIEFLINYHYEKTGSYLETNREIF